MGSEQLLILQMYAKFVGRLENRLVSLEEAQAWTFRELMCYKFQVRSKAELRCLHSTPIQYIGLIFICANWGFGQALPRLLSC